MTTAKLSPHKLLAPKTLRVKQRGEVAMIDSRLRGSRDCGLGVIGDAKPRLRNHAEIIGAVADDERVDIVEIGSLAKLDQRRKLGGAAENRFLHLAGQFTVAHHQFIGAVLLKAELFGDRLRKQGEAA